MLSLTGSLGTGIHCMSYTSSLSWACVALGNVLPPVFIPVFGSRYQMFSACSWRRSEESQDKMRIEGGKVREMGRFRQEGVAIVHSLCLISSQQIGKVLSFTFYCFCCLPSLHFFPSTVFKGKRFFFLLNWGYIFLTVKIFDGLLMNVFHGE